MAHVDLYDDTAEIYDLIELAGKPGTPITNKRIVDNLKAANAKTVLDMTCGTGAQTIELCKQKFKVTGSDMSEGMLKVAMRKSQSLDIDYFQADMRTVSLGKFDAIISMYNSVGHLSKQGLAQTVRNAFNNLADGGVLIFDIFNSELMKTITPDYKLIDALCEIDDTKYVRFTKSQFNEHNNHIEFTQQTYVQKGLMKPRVIEDNYSLQTYARQELEDIIISNGFSEVEITGDGMLDISKISGLVHFVVARKGEVLTI